MKAPDTLVLFTSEFPCGNGEPFLVNEFNILKEKFKKIIIFPTKYSKENLMPLGPNVSVENIETYINEKGNKTIFFTNLPLIGLIIIRELFYSKKKLTFLKNIREFNSYLVNAIGLSRQIRAFVNKGAFDNALYYSFWMNNRALALAVLKHQNSISNFIFRTNGFDLYENQTKYNYIPFRPFIFKEANKMFSVSKKGAAYMKEVGVNINNIAHSYFGTQDLGISVFDPKNKFTIFTCSDLRRIKRADRMVDILKNISFPVKWIHLGDKGDSEKVFYEKIKSLPANVEFELHERKKEYNEVLQFFKTHHINVFVLLSSTEGIPVSLIEAISFGIPIMATDVGGISEVISSDNGILIEKEFKDEAVAKKIIEFSTGEMNTEDFRKKVRADWEKRFSAKNNYETFYKQITEGHES